MKTTIIAAMAVLVSLSGCKGQSPIISGSATQAKETPTIETEMKSKYIDGPSLVLVWQRRVFPHGWYLSSLGPNDETIVDWKEFYQTVNGKMTLVKVVVIESTHTEIVTTKEHEIPVTQIPW